jgi:tetratricopeptide (TPR) repeat protein
MIEGQHLSKGKYGLFIAFDPIESTIIFSNKNDSWGSFFYDPKDDALRVKVKPRTMDKTVEWLRYTFVDQTSNSAIVQLEWENLSIPFRIEADVLKNQFEAFSSELKSPGSFTWQACNLAANWCLQYNYRLEEGLSWVELGITAFGGGQQFPVLSTKAQILDKLGRKSDSESTIEQALVIGSVNDINQYGRQLLKNGKPKEALDIFKYNNEKNPGQFVTLVGMARGLSATGDYKQAADYAMNALPLAPNEQNKSAIQQMIDKLKLGEDIN